VRQRFGRRPAYPIGASSSRSCFKPPQTRRSCRRLSHATSGASGLIAAGVSTRHDQRIRVPSGTGSNDMRARGSGRIINISPVRGLVPAPYMPSYSATKHAIEGYSESVDHEVSEHGVRVLRSPPPSQRVLRTGADGRHQLGGHAEKPRSCSRLRHWALSRPGGGTGQSARYTVVDEALLIGVVLAGSHTSRPRERPILSSVGRGERQTWTLRRRGSFRAEEDGTWP
jgi:short chain dehydrogenase